MVKFVYRFKTKLRVLALRLLKPLFDELYLNTHKLYGSKERLHLSAKAKMANTLFNTFSGSIHIHDCVFTGHNVSILPGTHDYRLTDEKSMHEIPVLGRDITIEEGVWIGSNVVILGPCRIGRDSVIAAGSVVTSDIPPSIIAGGIPARKIKDISFK